MTGTPAGWYPDPWAPQSGMRYWDGSSWTPQVAIHHAPPITSAGLWAWRLLAYVVDTIILGVVVSIVTLPFQFSMTSDLNEFFRQLERESSYGEPDFGQFLASLIEAMSGYLLWTSVATLALTLVYHAAMLRLKGATLGKLVIGLRVRNPNGSPDLGWGTVTARVLMQYGLPQGVSLATLASRNIWLMMLLGLVPLAYQLADGLWPLRDPQKRAIHDKVALTIVVKEGAPSPAAPASAA